MAPDGKRTVDELESALALIGEWLVAIYGSRLDAVVLTLQGFHTSAPHYYGIVPWLARSEGETPDTLPSRQVQDLAERVFTSLFPEARIDPATPCDVCDVARSGLVTASRITAHRRLELLSRFGRPEGLVGRQPLAVPAPGPGR